MIRGFILRRFSYPNPSRSIEPGPKFSMRTSARSTIRVRSVRPSGFLRSSVTPFLLPLSNRKNQASMSGCSDSARRPASPPGGSILMTVAPSHPSIWAQLGPASYAVRSSTTIPSSALANVSSVRIELRAVGRESDRLGPRPVVGLDVDYGRLARRPRPLERRTDLGRLLDVLTVRAEILGHLVVASVAEVAPRLVLIRIGRPAAVEADHHQDGDVVTDGRVDLHPVDPV